MAPEGQSEEGGVEAEGAGMAAEAETEADILNHKHKAKRMNLLWCQFGTTRLTLRAHFP